MTTPRSREERQADIRAQREWLEPLKQVATDTKIFSALEWVWHGLDSEPTSIACQVRFSRMLKQYLEPLLKYMGTLGLVEIAGKKHKRYSRAKLFQRLGARKIATVLLLDVDAARNILYGPSQPERHRGDSEGG